MPFFNDPATVNTANNYAYDALGNLVRDTREGITAIDWTAAGKVSRVVRTDGTVIRACLKIAFGGEPEGFREPAKARNPRRAGSSARVEQRRLGATRPRPSPKGNFVIGSTFAYGADGQRIMKEVNPAQGDAYREHYVRDAQGNIMAIYRATPGSLKLTERPLYGSARLGALRKSEELYSASASSDPDPLQQLELRYELTDHLGNVSAVLTGRLLPGNGMGSAWQPEVVAAQGYEPFGSLLPGRNYSSDSYRFGFNGQEKDDEINGATGASYTAEFWQYNPRIGRRWNLDPKPNPSISSYATFALNPIYYSDPLGDTVKYAGFKERVDVFFAKLGSKAFRSEFKSLEESSDVFTYRKGGSTSSRGGWVSQDKVNLNHDGSTLNSEFTVHYTRPSKEERSAPYGLSRKHGLFEETFHAADYLRSSQGLASGSGIDVFPDPETGGASLGWESFSLRIKGEAMAWKFAADNAPGVKTSGRFPVPGLVEGTDIGYTDRTLMRMIRETDVKDIGSIGRFLFAPVPISFTSTTSGASGETLIGPLYSR